MLEDMLKTLGNVSETVSGSVKGAFRIGETAATLASTGLGWVLGHRPPAPKLMRETFERLGATYIKLGQFIASSPSIFPAEYVNEFQKCLDKTDPLPYRTIHSIVRKELGDPYRIFDHIDKEPLASASIAQVHAAKLKTGEHVVLKVQKPGVSDILLTDLNFLFVAARVLEWIAPGFARTSLAAIIGDIQKTMMEECDFLNEAKNIKEFQEFLDRAGIQDCVAPKVYDKYTTLNVLTMERFYGVPLTDLHSIRKYSPNPEATLIGALNTWFASLMMCNFFHADVHAGNLMVLEDGRVGFIDFGIVGRIKPETWRSMNELMEAMTRSDFKVMAQSMLGIGATDEKVDVDRFAADLKQLFGGMQALEKEVFEGSINENELNQMVLDMVRVGEEHGIRFPREFALLMKQFLYFDRYVRLLAPGLDMFGDDRLQRLALEN